MSKRMFAKSIGLVAVSLSVLLSGCAGGGTGGGTEKEAGGDKPAGDTIKVGVANRTFKESAYLFMQQGSEAKAEEYGNVQIDWQACDLNIANQKNIVENFISQGYDAIVIEPCDSVSMVQQAREVRDAGISLIFIEQKMDGIAPDIWITGNNYQLGCLQVEDFVKRWGEDQPAKCVMLAGSDGDYAAEEIKRGVQETVAKYPNLELVFEQTIQDWDREKAMKSMEDAISVHGDAINAVFAANDGMALGAYKAAQNAGLEKDMYFYGGDNDQETNEMILAGAENIFVVDRGSFSHGEMITTAAVQLVSGEELTFDETDADDYKCKWAQLTMVGYDNLEPSKIKFPELFE